MISFSSSSTTQTVIDSGLSFESHFSNGFECLIARQDSPKLRFPDSMPLEFVRDTIELWNVMLSQSFPGRGYYAFSQADEMAHPGYHVLVLFSDMAFYDAFMGSVESEKLPPSFDGMVQRQFRD